MGGEGCGLFPRLLPSELGKIAQATNITLARLGGEAFGDDRLGF